MRVQKKASSGQQQAVNVPVLVTGFVEDNGQVGIKGTTIPEGKDVEVFLSTTGKNAENQNRPDLKKLRDGFKIGRTPYQLVPGGVVMFKGAFTLGDTNKMISTWPNVLGYNADDVKKYVGITQVGMLQMSHPNTSKPWGSFFAFEPAADKHLVGKTPVAVAAGIEAKATATNKPAFMVRLLDSNNQVVAYQLFSHFYIKDESRGMTPAEIAKNVCSQVAEMQAKFALPTTVNIVPADYYKVSPKSLTADEQGKSQLPTFLAAAKAFQQVCDDGEIDLVAKAAWIKLGGDHNEFVNGVYPLEPFGPGVSPVLLGGLEYSPALLESLAANAAQEAPADDAPTHEDIPAPGDQDDPFAGLEGADFDEPAVANGPR